jgi:DNA-binding beta-propeller fold protein YncE
VFQRPRSLTEDERGAELSPPVSECCKAAPSVLVFDRDGNLVKSWGGPGHAPNWPATEHAIYVDRAGNVWLAGNQAPANGVAEDRVILKFDTDGKLLATYGRPEPGPDNNQATDYFGRIAMMAADETARELYVADGYGNRRVAVIDMATGAFKRGWGAYGIPLAGISNAPLPAYAPGQQPARQFLGPVHCVALSRDGFVYVCDRTSNRVQVFTKDGKFEKEFFVRPATLANGAAWNVAFSSDPQQRYLLVGDGRNNVIWILNRDDGKVVGQFGGNGRNAGQFHWVHALATDSEGNLYTGEVDTGKRIQKFRVR